MTSRRALLRGGALLLGNWATAGAQTDDSPIVRFGIITDVHHADKPERGTRYYRESLGKLMDALSDFRTNQVAFIVELGDLVDAAADVDTEHEWLKQAVSKLRTSGAETHFVLGNHCIQTLKKSRFLTAVGREHGHYSFDAGGVRFIVLDACYRRDGVSYDAGNFDWKDTDIPTVQREWLKGKLVSAPAKAVIFVHQRVDIPGVHTIASAEAVREILESSGKVLAVFQGHSHQNDYRDVNGIHYCTMRAIVEGSGHANSGHAIVSMFAGDRLHVEGFRAQRDYHLPR